jgi:hypothetical protein
MAKQNYLSKEVKMNANNKKLVEDISKLIASKILIEEDESDRQTALSKQIDKLKLRADGEKEEAITDEQEDDAADTDEESEETESKETEPEETEPEDFRVAPPESIPAKITISQVEKQINNLRAGKSLKDKAISDELDDYFTALGEGEKQALFVYLASLASILTGGSSGDIAPSPESLDVDIAPESQHDKESVDVVDVESPMGNEVDPSPIVVGEASNLFRELMFIMENSDDDNHRCLNGELVPFGGERCVDDLDNRIDDMSQQRDSLSRSSADRASLNGTLKFLRQKKRKALKIGQQDQDLKLQSRINLSDEL